MLRSFKLGKLFGIPLYIHFTFLLLPAGILLANRGIGLVNSLFVILLLMAVFTCVVLHELGHALMARFFGIDTESITLYPIGGVARLERMSEKPSEEICIALAGPAVNLVLAVLLAPLAILAVHHGLIGGVDLYNARIGLGAAIARIAYYLLNANLGLLAFNLLPCFPMDGGRVLRALLSYFMGHLRATEMAARVGLLMAFLIAGLSLPAQSPMPIVLAVFVLFVGQRELQCVRQLHAERQAALVKPEAIPIPVPAKEDAPFSGVAWDSRSRVWVKWHNGHPVAYWG